MSVMVEASQLRTKKTSYFITIACAIGSSVIGGMVILGWNLGSESLIAVRPGFIPVQYNTALGFLACSLALLALVRSQKALATLAGGGIALLAAATAIEYLANIDLHIDNVFFNQLVADNIPGRMAPNTVAAFLCIGPALLLLARGWRWQWAASFSTSLAAFVAAVGLAGFTGYAVDIPSAYHWTAGRPIALLTTVAFVALAVGTISFACHASTQALERFPGWLPAPAVVFVMALCGLIAKALWDASWVARAPQSQHSLVLSAALVLLLGTAASTAMVGAFRLAATAQRRSRELELTNCAMKQEVQQRQQQQRRTEELNRALRMVSACDQAIAQCTTEEDLLHRVCRIAVEEGGYRLAWVGFALDDVAKTVRVAATAGEASAYVTDGFVSWADEPRGRGPTGTAIRTARLTCCDDVTGDPNFLPWRDRALQFGFRSTLVIPMLRAGRAFGALSLYASGAKVFHQEERALFTQLVEDLTFGVEAIRTRQAQARSEAALAASEERYRSLTIATAQVIWTTDPEGLVRTDMPTWRAFTGASLEQIQGWGWLDSLHPDDRQRTAEIWSDAVEHRSLYETEYRLRHHDGEYRDVWVRGVPVLSQDGSLREWVGTCTDVTGRRHAERQILRASLYARTLLESSLDPLVTIGKDGRIMDVNRATEQITGVLREQLIGSDFCDYFTDPDKAREGYQRVFAEGAVRDYPLAIRSGSGAVTDVLYNATLFQDQDGRVEGIFAAARDITERKRAQEELRRYAEELQRSNTELQEFAFVASHDLQEPLRKITAFSERLRDRSCGQLDDTSLDYLNRMHSAAGRMGALIDSLLDYSRVSTRAMPFQTVDLAATLLGILADLEQRIQDSGARIVVQTLPTVEGDPTQLRQLFQNLLANALKFHAPGAAPSIEVRAERWDGRWRISVADNGIGFDLAYAEKIFRPFQRLHGRNEYEGSGMGLAICRKIAQRHGAQIDVTSRPGQGATFTVSLPAAHPTDAEPADPAERIESCPKNEYESCSPKTMMTTTC